jgi:predicted ATPase
LLGSRLIIKLSLYCSTAINAGTLVSGNIYIYIYKKVVSNKQFYHFNTFNFKKRRGTSDLTSPHTHTHTHTRVEICAPLSATLQRITNYYPDIALNIRRSFEKFVDWRQCTALMQMKAVTVMPSCSGGGNVVVA